MTARTVAADRSVQALMSTVLASLPVSFTSSSSTPDVQVIDGADGWSDRARELAAAGTDVIVVAPTPLRASAAHSPGAADLAGPGTGRIVLDLPWAGNAALPHARRILREVVPGAGLLEIHAEVDEAADQRAALLDIGLTLRALGIPLEAAQVLHADPAGTHLLTRTAELHATLALDRTARGEHELRLRLIGAGTTAEITLPGPATARPATVVRTDTHGRSQLPTLWESSHRTTWRRLRGLGDAEPVTTPEDLRPIQDVLAGVLDALGS